ncbi:MAG: transglutaminase-like domain-containing protein, partial [Chloroflexota bacterium]
MMMAVWNRVRSIHTIVWVTLFGVAFVVSRGVAESVINIDADKMITMTIVAIILGSISVVSRVPLWLGVLAVISLGVEYLLLFWGNLSKPIGGMIAALQYLPNVTPIYEQALAANDVFQSLAFRLANWWATLDNPTVFDPLIPQLIWGMGIWLSSVFLAWSVWKRYQTMLGILPFGILLGSAAFFTGELYEEMAFYLLLIIVLQATSQGLWRQNRWIREKLDYATSLPFDLLFTVLPAALVIVGVSYMIPSFSINKITQNISDLFGWNYARTDAVASSFGLRSSVNPFVERAGLSGLPRSHLLGNSPDLGRQTVMTIQTGELASIPYEVEGDLEIPQHYWQSAVYDHYTSRGWTLSPGEIKNFDPDNVLQEPFGPGRELTQIVNRGPYAPNLLHTSGIPLSVDQPAEATVRTSGDFIAATVEGSNYIAKSWVMDVTPSELRSAGTEYPEDIARIYLRLPRDLPVRVRNLALELTARETNPYDMALAIEQHLRQIPYNLEVAKPPPGVDVADYFLFDLQEGYCDYYATSMAIMARAAGLPSRFVIGYITGYYDVEQTFYQVTEAEAHSWVQIYFPGIGWVDFEPTGGRPEIIRQDEQALPA